MWRFEVLLNLGKVLYILSVAQQAHVLRALLRQFSRGVKQEDLHLVVLLRQHACHCQSIATIVARTSKHHKGARLVPAFGDDLSESLRCTLHQVDGVYRLMLNSILVPVLYLCASEYLHNTAKIQNICKRWLMFVVFLVILRLIFVFWVWERLQYKTRLSR